MGLSSRHSKGILLAALMQLLGTQQILACSPRQVTIRMFECAYSPDLSRKAIPGVRLILSSDGPKKTTNESYQATHMIASAVVALQLIKAQLPYCNDFCYVFVSLLFD